MGGGGGNGDRCHVPLIPIALLLVILLSSFSPHSSPSLSPSSSLSCQHRAGWWWWGCGCRPPHPPRHFITIPLVPLVIIVIMSLWHWPLASHRRRHAYVLWWEVVRGGHGGCDGGRCHHRAGWSWWGRYRHHCPPRCRPHHPPCPPHPPRCCRVNIGQGGCGGGVIIIVVVPLIVSVPLVVVVFPLVVVIFPLVVVPLALTLTLADPLVIISTLDRVVVVSSCVHACYGEGGGRWWWWWWWWWW